MSFLNYLNFYLEAKEALIKKLPFSDAQKEEIQGLVNKYPQKASKVPWQKKDLSYEEILEILKEVSGKQVKAGAIGGLVEGKDYLNLTSKFANYPRIKVYIPLCYKASRILANAKVGGMEGEWCISYQKNSFHWFDYVGKHKELPVFVIREALLKKSKEESRYLHSSPEPKKFAVMVPAPGGGDIEIWDENDSKISENNFSHHTGLNLREIEEAINTYGRPRIDKLIRTHPDSRLYFDKGMLWEKLIKFFTKEKKRYKGNEHIISLFEELSEKTGYTYEINKYGSKDSSRKLLRKIISDSDWMMDHWDIYGDIDAYGWDNPEDFLPEKEEYTDEDRQLAQDKYEQGIIEDDQDRVAETFLSQSTLYYIKREMDDDLAEEVFWSFIIARTKEVLKDVVNNSDSSDILSFLDEYN